MRSINKYSVRIISCFLVVSVFLFTSSFGQHKQKRARHGRNKHKMETGSISVVSSLPCNASIAEYIGGDFVRVSHIASGNQDPHFVQPKPSYAFMLKRADLFITTGLDLELWVPTMLDKARNKNILEGAPGYVSAATDAHLMQKPGGNPDRSMGDVHIYGNPHIHTSPINSKIMARNIKIGLSKVSPGNSDIFQQNYADYVNRIDRAMFGDRLVQLFGGELLTKMLLSGTLIEFLENKEYQGEKLIDKLGGWLKEAMPFRGKEMICYHKNWIYFARDFGIKIVDYIEPKPGIPPTARHVKEVIEKIQKRDIKIMLVANYFEKNSPNMVAGRTGIKAVFVPMDVGGEHGVDSYFELIDFWIKELNDAFLEVDISATN